MLTAEQQIIATEYVDMAETQAWAFVARSGGRMDIDTAKSAAMLGVVQAVDSWPDYLRRHPDFDPGRLDYRRAYILKRLRGAILDEARAQDHLTRSARVRVKSIRQAEDDGARGEQAVAAATGLTVGQVRQLENDAQMPVSLEDQSGFDLYADSASLLIDQHADTESQAVTSSLMTAFLKALDALPAIQQVLIAFVFHRELDITVAAKAVYLEPDDARKQLEAAVLEIHRALLSQVDSAA